MKAYRRIGFGPALLFSLLLAVSGCKVDSNSGTSTGENSEPVISSITATPAEVKPEERTTLRCNAWDDDGDVLTYRWSASTGSFPNGSNGIEPVWEAPDREGEFRIYATASDGIAEATSSITVLVDSDANSDDPSNTAPLRPASPNPSNGATNTANPVILSWTGSDPDGDDMTYDVHFGTSPAPPRVSTDQSATSYDPGSLQYDARYYWRVDVEDEHGDRTEGAVWMFEMESEGGGGGNNPPTRPSSPFPINNMESVPVVVELNWICADPDGEQVRYDVYFGTVSDPPRVSQDQTGNVYDPDELQSDTRYYWYIVARDIHDEESVGPQWTFTTVGGAANQPPTMPANPSPPNNYENASVDALLSWTGGDPDGDAVTYDVYFGNTSTPPRVSTAQSETYFQTSDLTPGTQYFWQIIAEDSEGASTTGPIWVFTTYAP